MKSTKTANKKRKEIEEEKKDKEDIVEEEEETQTKKTKVITFNKKRLRKLNNHEVKKKGTIVYWMSRDQRVEDNWALIYAQKLANENDCELLICFFLINYPNAPLRHYDFMIKGLKELEKRAIKYNIPFIIKIGKAEDKIKELVEEHGVTGVVTDFSPLRISVEWRTNVAKVLGEMKIPIHLVDAHNVIPVWVTSDKEEHAAKTIRKKIENNEGEYLTEFIEIQRHELNKSKKETVNWKEVDEFVDKTCDKSVGPLDWISPGYDNALKMMNTFFEKKLDKYGDKRNDPTLDYASNMSPYLHFGQISAQRILLEARKHKKKGGYASFKEELLVRRELADNFCHFNKNYDNFDGFKEWARTSLNLHESDKRDKVYTDEQFETGKTHDPLWNAAQFQLIYSGKMHGFMRMYWAKKILEWTPDPKKALSLTNYLNDKYSIDGRDPNGYVGSAWSIGGIHDQGWKERNVFGKIRFMNFDGCKRKFDVQKYINMMKKLKK